MVEEVILRMNAGQVIYQPQCQIHQVGQVIASGYLPWVAARDCSDSAVDIVHYV